MAKKTYILKRVRDGKVFRKRLDEEYVNENMDVLREIILPDGEKYARCVGDEVRDQWERGDKIKLRPKWPFASWSCGVQPDQIKETQEYLRKKTGYNVEFKPDGDIIFTSRKMRKVVAEAMGYGDRSGGYSDPQFNNI